MCIRNEAQTKRKRSTEPPASRLQIIEPLAASARCRGCGSTPVPCARQLRKPGAHHLAGKHRAVAVNADELRAVPSPEATAPCDPRPKRCLEVIAVQMAVRRVISICDVATPNRFDTSSRIDVGSTPLVIKGSVSSALVSAVKSTAVPGGGRRPMISKLSSTLRVRIRVKRSGKTSRATMAVAVGCRRHPA